jgi:hypothetical protein
MERIAPNLVASNKELWKYILEHCEHGSCLDQVKSHFVSHAVHFNSDTEFHLDKHSPWCGFDAIGVIGNYDGGALYFPDLGE